MLSYFVRPVVAVILFGCLPASAASCAGGANMPIQFAPGDGQLTVVINGLPVATYYYRHEEITRPFFAHVRAPSGIQVTRQHPPIAGQDLTDHATFHPGIWMAFGDISGNDYWRLQAPVRHAEFVEQPAAASAGQGSFAVRNRYLDQRHSSQIVCEEVTKYTFIVRPAGYLLVWDSTFSSEREFYFGDQEEMGLGIRVATPIRVGDPRREREEAVPGNGSIRDSAGRRNGEEVWGQTAEWCDYSGTMAGQHVGIALFAHPENFGPSWLHARDYGFVAINPFGRGSFNQGEASKIVVRPGEKLRLRYGVLLHSGPEGAEPDLQSAYEDYLEVASQ